MSGCSCRDAPPAQHAGRIFLDELLATGVRIFELHDSMPHAMTVTIDRGSDGYSFLKVTRSVLREKHDQPMTRMEAVEMHIVHVRQLSCERYLRGRGMTEQAGRHTMVYKPCFDSVLKIESEGCVTAISLV